MCIHPGMEVETQLLIVDGVEGKAAIRTYMWTQKGCCPPCESTHGKAGPIIPYCQTQSERVQSQSHTLVIRPG